MPPLDRADYLVGYLFEVGPTMAAGMGAGPVTFGEISAWAALTGVALTRSDARRLRLLSIAYLGESRRAEKHDAIAPWSAEVQPEELRRVADSLKAWVKGMMAS